MNILVELLRCRCLKTYYCRRYPCWCDENCHLYGDCCWDLAGLPGNSYSKLPDSLSSGSFSCNKLNPDREEFQPRVRLRSILFENNF